MHSRQLTHLLSAQSITPVWVFLLSAPDGQLAMQRGSAHCRQSASSGPPPLAAHMMRIRDCARLSVPDFACAQAVMQSPQLSQRSAWNWSVGKQMPMVTANAAT